ncbi:hypothetical protein, partial [Tenacibaculum maritimum]
TNNDNLINNINSYWKLNSEDDFIENDLSSEIIEQVKQHSSVTFDKGFYEKSLVEIKNRASLLDAINFFKLKLEKEFKIYLQKSDKKHLFKDINILYEKRKKYEESFKTKLEKASGNREVLKKVYNNKLEFNCLLMIAHLQTKEKIVSMFTEKGFNWTALNELSNLGLLWMKRGFDNKIQDFVINKTLRNRLIAYIENNGIDIYVLETKFM